ncbi:hypothetical protein GCM10010435_16760 [Winogradskya consettensis]|uniref:Uncharacterized protein n=1 Tax=Winogradskya consettensis TaxID=113560 RepID=A0A919SWL5_9ACTN|nr:hypothetical protein [Actinoplanes consettensis]GIM78801.1 hypothetical protein Aco04nite_62290 [Actinoplanes consettensis]
MHDSVYDLAGDDPRLAKVLRASLRKLADGPDGPLKEMAEGVLNDQIDLRQAAMSQAYGDEIGAAFNEFAGYFTKLDPEERDRIVQETQHQLDVFLDGPSDSPASHDQVRS